MVIEPQVKPTSTVTRLTEREDGSSSYEKRKYMSAGRFETFCTVETYQLRNCIVEAME